MRTLDVLSDTLVAASELQECRVAYAACVCADAYDMQ